MNIQNIVIGPQNRGLQNNVKPYYIDNDAFPQLINAYQWRGRAKRKRGTTSITRLTVVVTEFETMSSASPWTFNLYTVTGITKESFAQIKPQELVIVIQAGPDITFTDNGDGTLSANVMGNSGTINYLTGSVTLTHTAGAGIDTLISFDYYPTLPVMGLKTYISRFGDNSEYVAFDTTRSYNISTANPYPSINTNFYKNPAASSDLPNYTPKTVSTEFFWNGETYQLFDAITYQGALWAANSFQIPFVVGTTGMQFKPIEDVTIDSASAPAVATIEITGHGLVEGDFVFINEVVGITGINFQTGYVTDVVDVDNVEVTFPSAVLGGTYTSDGIAQYLTNTADPDLDCIKWYDGNPRNGTNLGWVNFCPPVSNESFRVLDLRSAQWYVVGARKIITFKDRLLFLGPIVQTSAEDSQVYIPDGVIYSQNGTPYYTASFDGDPGLPNTDFLTILAPMNETAIASAWFSDVAGFGGFIQAGIDEKLNTAEVTDDDIIAGFDSRQTRIIYTSSELQPFQFYGIDSELGSSSPQGSVNLKDASLTRGDRGFVATSSQQSARFDDQIPDEVFQSKLIDHGSERVIAVRDFQDEWMYFTFSDPDNALSVFPGKTLFYNYKDASWAIFKEMYTAYGEFKKQTGYTWQTIGTEYPSWSVWNVPWNSGQSTVLQPEVIAGNTQGFVVERGDDIDECRSLMIYGIDSNGLVTSPDHGLLTGDFIVINDCLGPVSQFVNGKIFQVIAITKDTFSTSPQIPNSTYSGLGTIIRLSVPFIQSKQFPTSWEYGNKTRLGVQRYLLTKTSVGRVNLLIFLSTNSADAYNVDNNSCLYSTILYTCPESTNLGLTPANVNLNMPTGFQQSEIWHRMNTSLIGDVVQFGITLGDALMHTYLEVATPLIITNITQATNAVITVDNDLSPGNLIVIKGVLGMTEINKVIGQQNSGIYQIIDSTATTITIDYDTTAFTAYASGGTATYVALEIQNSEIEIHGAVLSVSQAGVLA